MAVVGNYVYWTNSYDVTIGRANLDGTGVNQSLISGTDTPFGIASDGTYLYWANYGGTIGRANLDGTGANQSFISTGGMPVSVAVSGNYIYWTVTRTTRSGGRTSTGRV